jgi:hypothetical protein
MDLTGEDIWMLLCAPASASSRELATRHGLPLAHVMRVRLHYRLEAWSCPVDDVPCIVCGELVTVGRATAGSDHASCVVPSGTANSGRGHSGDSA